MKNWEATACFGVYCEAETEEEATKLLIAEARSKGGNDAFIIDVEEGEDYEGSDEDDTD